jgi:hypothetical protein
MVPENIWSPVRAVKLEISVIQFPVSEIPSLLKLGRCFEIFSGTPEKLRIDSDVNPLTLQTEESCTISFRRQSFLNRGRCGKNRSTGGEFEAILSFVKFVKVAKDSLVM